VSSQTLLSMTARIPELIRVRIPELLRGEGIAGTLARGSSLAFIVSVTGMGVSLLVQMMLGRVLGRADYGVYVYALSWMQIALVGAKLDFDSAAVRFVALYRGREDWGALRGYLDYGRNVITIASLAATAIALGAVWLFRGRLSNAEFVGCLIAFAMLPIAARLQFTTIALQGLKRVLAGQAPQQLVRPLALGLVIAFAHYALGTTVNAEMALALNLAVLTGVMALSWYYLRLATPPEVHATPARYEVREWWKVASSFMLTSAAQMALSQSSDIVLVGSIVGTSAAAVYGACGQLTLFIGFGATAVAVIAAPMIAELYGRGDHAKLRRMISMIAWVNTLATIPGVILLVVFGRLLLRGWGPEFVEGYPVLMVLTGSATFFNITAGIGGYILNMTDHHRVSAYIVVASALVNIALALLLIPEFGLLGAAWATTMANVVKCIVLVVFIQRKLDINPLPSWRRS
jgi:O-antigen/teichoic acid export membrane protein